MLERLNSTHFLSRKGVVKGGVREGGGEVGIRPISIYMCTYSLTLVTYVLKCHLFGSLGVAIRRIADLPIQNYLRNYPSVQLRNYTAE